MTSTRTGAGWRGALGYVTLAFLLLPFPVLLAQSAKIELPFDSATLRVFAFTALQAALSALLSVAFGFLGALGLLASSRSVRLERAFEALILLPNAVPSLLVILAALNLYAGTRGLAGIVWVHALLNIGLVAVTVARLLATRIGPMADLAWVEGATRTFFLRRVVWPYLRGDLMRIWLFVFAICFCSFAVPLALGGSRATTVEVLIFEKIRLSLDWSVALGLTMMQTIFIVLLSFLVRGGQTLKMNQVRGYVPLLAWRPGLAVAVAPGLIVILGLLARLPAGLSQFSEQHEMFGDLGALFVGSCVSGFLTGSFVILLLLLLMIIRPEGAVRRILLGYVAPSSVLTGFALLMLWRAEGWASWVKIALGLSLLGVPTFYRLQWDSLLQSLQGQVTIAQTLGAGESLILRRILLPQLWPSACFLAGLAAFWAWGDFAISAVVAERTMTLAMLARGLLGAYRLDAATIVVWMIIVGGTLSFLAFWGLGKLGERCR